MVRALDGHSGFAALRHVGKINTKYLAAAARAGPEAHWEETTGIAHAIELANMAKYIRKYIHYEHTYRYVYIHIYEYVCVWDIHTK